MDHFDKSPLMKAVPFGIVVFSEGYIYIVLIVVCQKIYKMGSPLIVVL